MHRLQIISDGFDSQLEPITIDTGWLQTGTAQAHNTVSHLQIPSICSISFNINITESKISTRMIYSYSDIQRHFFSIYLLLDSNKIDFTKSSYVT